MHQPQQGESLLIADIGGTNARFAIAKAGTLTHTNPMTLAVKEHASLQQAIEFYRHSQHIQNMPKLACLAVACPTHEDKIKLTNSHWSFLKSELKQALGFEHLWVINDYTALAHSIVHLTPEQKHRIGCATPRANQTLAVIGPGTGLGMSGLIYHQNSWAVLVSEGGHIDFAPSNKLEMDILSYLLKQHSRVSVERLLSGMGIENIYQALGHITDQPSETLNATEIALLAQQNNPLATQTLDVFFGILASTAGNCALMLQAKGGVFITGGIVPKLLTSINAQSFRQRFENKGRFKDFMATIATEVVTDTQPGLLGAAAFVRHLIAPP